MGRNITTSCFSENQIHFVEKRTGFDDRLANIKRYECPPRPQPITTAEFLAIKERNPTALQIPSFSKINGNHRPKGIQDVIKVTSYFYKFSESKKMEGLPRVPVTKFDPDNYWLQRLVREMEEWPGTGLKVSMRGDNKDGLLAILDRGRGNGKIYLEREACSEKIWIKVKWGGIWYILSIDLEDNMAGCEIYHIMYMGLYACGDVRLVEIECVEYLHRQRCCEGLACRDDPPEPCNCDCHELPRLDDMGYHHRLWCCAGRDCQTLTQN